MAEYLMTLDIKWAVDTPYSEFRQQAVAHGWHSWIGGDNASWYRLPNTTFRGTFGTMDEAEQALYATRDATAAETKKPVIITKWVIADYGAARFASDEQQPMK